MWVIDILFLWGTHEKSEKVRKWLESWKMDPLFLSTIFIIVVGLVAAVMDAGAVRAMFMATIALSPVWLPLFLVVFLWVSWVDYVRLLFWFSQGTVLLEVQLPPEVTKSPVAMETFLTTLHNTGGEGTFVDRFWLGKYRPVWALEIASNGGKIGFYIHLRKAWRNIVEARLYGLFPEAKVTEVDDYAAKLPFNLTEYDMWGAEFNKLGPQALPIKSYIDYGLDRDPKEEFKIDPIANILELLASISEGEYFWMQIILKGHRGESEWYGIKTAGDDAFKKGATAEIEKSMADAAKRAQKVIDEYKIEQGRMVTMTKNEQLRIEQIERSMAKLVFDCGVRVLYIAKKEKFNGINIGATVNFFGAFRGQDTTREYNNIMPTRGVSIFDYAWQDFHDIRHRILKRNLFFQYKHRAYFYVPYDQVPVYLTTEELATLWHFPSSGIVTPGLNRVSSRRSEAPLNLPI